MWRLLRNGSRRDSGNLMPDIHCDCSLINLLFSAIMLIDGAGGGSSYGGRKLGEPKNQNQTETNPTGITRL